MIELEGPLGKVVDELYRDGVEKGRKDADHLIAEARETASSIVAQAENEASGIISRAKEQATREAEKTRGELELAARDVLIQFQQDLADALVSLLRPEVNRLMSDEPFIAKLLEKMFGDTWSGDQPSGELRMSVFYNAGLFDHLLARMAGDAEQRSAVLFDLHKRGFEYRIDNSVVEVTDDSILALLRRYVSERTYELLTRLSKQRG